MTTVLRAFFGWFCRPVVRWSIVGIFMSGVIVYGWVLVIVIQGFGGSATLPAECAVVFGTAVHPVRDAEGDVVASRAGPGITRRVSKAASLFREGKLQRLFLTGGKGEGSALSEAEVMRDVAMDRGVPASAIVLETKATSTKENIEFTRPLTLDCDEVVGISDAYHLARIEFLAKSAGWNLPTIPADGYVGETFMVKSSLREAAAIIYLALVQVLT
jgi:uncharacterized SAM-binding protein YcdF (DUF218 family)